MKKSYNSISDDSNEKNELTRRIYRSLSEVVRQLDDIRGRSKSIADLFLPCLATLRIRLHDLCYKLILTDPLGYGKKGEELLWKKGYHDVFTTAKRLKKDNKWSSQEAGLVHGLLISGVGHYQHLLFKLQSDYRVNIQGFIDFSISISDLGLSKGKTSPHKLSEKNCLESWAKESCHRCLIYLGDLNRYLLDIFPLWDSGTAERYYLQAANMNINCGRPFNQLGTLAGTKNYNLDAVYYYVRCMIRPDSFEGAEANLRKALDKNVECTQFDPLLPKSAPVVQKLISKFLLLFDIWYFEKSVDYSIYDLCHEILQNFELCLNEENEDSFQLDSNEMELSNLTPFKNRVMIQPNSLNSDMTLKIVILAIICVEKLQKKDSQNRSVAMSFCLELFSLLLQKLRAQFQLFYLRFGIVENNFQTLIQYDAWKRKSLNDDSQLKLNKMQKFKKKNKYNETTHDMSNGFLTNDSDEKCMNNEKKRDKNDLHQNLNPVENDSELSNIKLTETQHSKENMKKKGKLKRRKRIRPNGLCDSELSDSDITVNDTSSENSCFSSDFESDDLISSDSEDLDETLLIIDKKIKDKKNKNDEKSCELNGLAKNIFLNAGETDVESGGFGNGACSSDTVSNVGEKKNLVDHSDMKNSYKNGETRSFLNGNKSCSEFLGNSDQICCNDKKLIDTEFVSSHEFAVLAKDSNEHDNFLSKKHPSLMKSECIGRNLDSKEFIQFLSKQDWLKAVKIFCDWLASDGEAVRMCTKNSKTVLAKLVSVVNLLICGNKLFVKGVLNKGSDIPLSEDVSFRGVPVLEQCQKNLDWNFYMTNALSNREEILLRIHKLIKFGNFLVKQEGSGIVYNKKECLFHIVGQNGVKNSSLHVVHEKQTMNSATRKGQLMKNMGQLWLKAEVRELESRVRKRGGNFSPYLVIDCEALIEHIVLVKQLVGSRQFIVIIPTVVLSHLDECKRDSGRARETIRWLESQFQHGNRSLRAQKSQERFSLPLIKYPKKKDKEAWNFFQIVECCHYFSKQSEFQCSYSNLLVTLLTGQRDIALCGDNKKEDFGKDYSPIGVAKNFGINLEYIEAFHTKWKLSTKSHG